MTAVNDSREILVFPRDTLRTGERFLQWDSALSLLESIESRMTWVIREEAEKSEELLQAIPCAVIRSGNEQFRVMRRVKEGRRDLSSKISLVVGGHVDRTVRDFGFLQLLDTTLRREILEELGVHEITQLEPVGIVIDHSSIFASRHVGFVYEATIDDAFIPLAREEFSARSIFNGQSFSPYALNRFTREFDPWSWIIFADYIRPSCPPNTSTQSEFPFS